MNSHRLLALLLLLPWILGVFPVSAQGDPKDKKSGPPLPDGLKALKHADANVRYKAVHTLAEVGSLAKFAVPDLREMLADPSPLVRVKVAEALWKIEKTPTTVLMPVLLQAMKDKNPRVRAAAPPVIVQFGSKAKPALPALTLALQDKEFDVKLAAIMALGDLGPLARDSAPALLALADDKGFFLLEPFVGAALTNLGDGVVPTLTQALTDKSFDRRRVAAYSLGSMGPNARAAAPSLAVALKSDDPATRKLVARALGKIGPDAKDILPHLEVTLIDKDATVRIEAALAIWFITGETRHVPVLTKALTDESTDVREIACQALGTMKKAAREAVGPVAKLLNDKELRLRAIMTLGEIGPAAEPALADLKKLLTDKDLETKLTSAFAVWQITGQAKEALPVLEKGLESEVHDRLAIRLLGDMGGAAESVLPTLVALYRAEEVASYRQLLAIAIKKIDPKAAMKLGIK